MASTNKTTNYNLSQYIGTDKPTYLEDYNSDMRTIDSQMKTNADNVATAISASETASTNASTALSTANTANTNASTALSTANTASTTATNANTNATTAVNTANTANGTANTASTNASTALTKANAVESSLNTFENKFNFTDIKDLTFSVTNGSVTANNIKCATNSDGSIGKVYGRIQFTRTGNNNTFTASTDLRPTENITINSLGALYLKTSDSTGSWTIWSSIDITIATDGTVTFSTEAPTTDAGFGMFIFYPCLLFMQDFGDTPTPNSN